MKEKQPELDTYCALVAMFLKQDEPLKGYERDMAAYYRMNHIPAIIAAGNIRIHRASSSGDNDE